ncbi:NAD(P)/FAD-dependent oxidoreductase Ecym_3372 [Eremothecium cymbalariae DBVPG|uniref:L-2-hydroxyglutarate dehydrogenase, mitochondrial n=1 Tax=Eremothecium cymbalariae (strain CBS 270.75 / DBVPG 7215 / KCTC 17166 / NRRL Y-17582) TaxID=931890 RepID=G8JRU0_ERECY|nr:Hypothetical protein Ecym_3372 [Eremothecium cymbalariae DBVPG\
MLRNTLLSNAGRSVDIRCLTSNPAPAVHYSHAIIGGGVVGLAIAAELSKVATNKILLLEKHPRLGMETSSRNSEVIHAGLYYPKDSLKSKLCIEGNRIIYSELNPTATGITWHKCGKWIIAQNDIEEMYLENLYSRAKYDLNLEVEMLQSNKLKLVEPSIHVERCALSSSSSGIIDSHSLINYLHLQIEINNGEVALGTEVTGLQRYGSCYIIRSEDAINGTGDEVEIVVENVVNAAGLYADKICNFILPSQRHKRQYFAKGTYFKLTQPGPPVSRLIYPVPPKNGKSLGTHLTIDLTNQIRFGPDLEYIDSPDNYSTSYKNIFSACEAIRTYYPHVHIQNIQPDYCGIRPKLSRHDDEEFHDFYIKEEENFPGFVNLLGIESPGLTSSIAIARYIKNIYHG